MKKIILAAIISLVSVSSTVATAAANEAQVIEIKATEKGFEPSTIDIPADVPIRLKVTRTTDDTCATEMKFKDRKINQKLPLNKAVFIDLGKVKKGSLKYACGMNMFKGELNAK